MKLLGVCVVGVLAGCLVRGPAGPSTSTSAGAAPDAERASGEGSNPVIAMPDVTGLSRADAEARLRAGGVRGEISIEGDDDGRACGTVPGAGRETRAALTVTISFCGGHKSDRPMAEPPNLVGLTEAAATQRAHDVGFTGRIDVVRTSQEGCKRDTVCSAEPIRWYVGGHLTLYLGLDPPPAN